MHVKNNCKFFFNTKSWGTAPRIQPMQVRSASYLSHKNVYCHHWQDALFWSIFYIQMMDNTEYTFKSFTGDEPNKIGGGIQYPLILDLAKQTPWIFFLLFCTTIKQCAIYKLLYCSYMFWHYCVILRQFVLSF